MYTLAYRRAFINFKKNSQIALTIHQTASAQEIYFDRWIKKQT